MMKKWSFLELFQVSKKSFHRSIYQKKNPKPKNYQKKTKKSVKQAEQIIHSLCGNKLIKLPIMTMINRLFANINIKKIDFSSNEINLELKEKKTKIWKENLITSFITWLHELLREIVGKFLRKFSGKFYNEYIKRIFIKHVIGDDTQWVKNWDNFEDCGEGI